MEETPICDSVERDLEISVDELTASVGAGPVPDRTLVPAARPGVAPA
jgi:hypothetical protein